MNRRRSSLAASPLLIGAITTLIVVVAVFLSYNANNGLPFVPTYNIKVELPETAGLQASNQVRIAGTRVGLVSSLKPHENPRTGRVTAIAELHLEKKIEPLPANTKVIVQSVSTVGLKYLELEKGSSRQTLKPGRTIPIAQTREPVNIEELFNMFNKPTRTAIKINSNNFGDGLAGRGLGLNNTIAELRPLVIHAIPALHNLALPATGLHELFVALDRVASQTAPIAQQQAEYFSNLDTFFKAWASVAPSIEATNRGGPASLQQAIYSLPHEAPFYENAAEFMHLLRPSATSLRTVAPQLGHAFSVGATNLAAATALNTKLAESSQALKEFATQPCGLARLRRLRRNARSRQPAARRDRARAGQLQLLDAGVPQPREPRVRERRRGHARARQHAALSDRSEQRGLPVGGARERSGHRKSIGDQLQHRPQQPPALQPLPEHDRARSAKSVRSRQRDIRARGADGRQPARERCDEQPRNHEPGRQPARRKVPGRDAQGARARQSADQAEAQEQGEGEGQMRRLRFWGRRNRVAVVDLQRAHPVRAGIVLLVLIAIAVYFGFTKHIPFKHGFRLKAQFATVVDIQPKSPVRIAGVTIGQVTTIQREGNTGLVNMEIESRGLPIHSDATVKIRPRLFLEGNWFVELQPGSPSAKTVSSGPTIPITQSSDPVQLDQVLDALNTDTRATCRVS